MLQDRELSTQASSEIALRSRVEFNRERVTRSVGTVTGVMNRPRQEMSVARFLIFRSREQGKCSYAAQTNLHLWCNRIKRIKIFEHGNMILISDSDSDTSFCSISMIKSLTETHPRSAINVGIGSQLVHETFIHSDKVNLAISLSSIVFSVPS